MTGLGGTLVLLNRMDEAEVQFRQAVGRHPGDWSAYNLLGRFLFQSGRYADAAEEYRKVVALDPGNSQGHSNLGTAYLFADEFELAAPALERAISIEPRANTYSSLGLMHYYLGRKEQAVASHELAVQLAPNDSLNWANLGDALWYAGRPDDSRRAFENAEELVNAAMAVNPNDPINLMDLAWISAMLDRSDEALTLIERAANLAPEDPYVFYIRGLIQTRRGNFAGATTALELAAEKGYSLKVMAAEPHLETLRDYPDFVTLIEDER